MKYAGERIFFLVHEGEILKASTDESFEGEAMEINEGNACECAEEAGFNPEELDDDEMDEYRIMGGYEGGFAYADYVDVPEEEADEDEEYESERVTEESTFATEHNDEFSYGALFTILDYCQSSSEEDEDDEDDDWGEDNSWDY